MIKYHLRLPYFHDLCPQIIVRANFVRLNTCVIQYAQNFPDSFICKKQNRAKDWKLNPEKKNNQVKDKLYMLVFKCFCHNLQCWRSISETDIIKTFEMCCSLVWVTDLLILALKENRNLFQNYFDQLTRSGHDLIIL